jgi:hypothetical protein
MRSKATANMKTPVQPFTGSKVRASWPPMLLASSQTKKTMRVTSSGVGFAVLFGEKVPAVLWDDEDAAYVTSLSDGFVGR